MKLTEALLGEHGLLHDLLDEVEAIAAGAKTAAEISAAIAAPVAVLLRHANLEDEILFPALEDAIGRAGMCAAMRAEHRLIEAMAERVLAARELETSHRLLDDLLATTRTHFMKEEKVLFPTAERHVDAERLAALVAKWAAIRTVALV